MESNTDFSHNELRFTLTRIDRKKKKEKTKSDKDVEKSKHLYTADRNVNGTATLENSMATAQCETVTI